MFVILRNTNINNEKKHDKEKTNVSINAYCRSHMLQSNRKKSG